jgi:hypothetical protein
VDLARVAADLFPDSPFSWDARGLLTAGGATVQLAVTQGPVPNAQAETAAFLSPSSINGRWRLPSHQAHLEVSLHGVAPVSGRGLLGALSSPRPASSLEQLGAFTRAVAVVTQAAGALGVFWSAAPVTHAPDFFIAMAREALPLPAWLGVSVTPEDDARTSVLSFGMGQLGLPELLVCAARDEAEDAVDFFYSALAQVAERGTAPEEGETVPRSLLSRPKARYVTSPVDEKARIWRLDL